MRVEKTNTISFKYVAKTNVFVLSFTVWNFFSIFSMIKACFSHLNLIAFAPSMKN